MNRRQISLVILMLTTLITMGATSDARGMQYSMSWNNQPLLGHDAFMKNGEWYIPSTALEQAYHLESSTSTEGTLDLYATAKTPSYFNYQPSYYQNKVITIMYHNVEKDPSDVTFISPEQLEEQMTALIHHGFHFITMDDYVDFMDGHKTIPDNAVLLTFDDGYETFYTEVYPLLKKHRLTATNFVIVSTIDDPNQPGRPKLSWDQMRAMMKDGFSFYSHTYNSHAYASINNRGVQKPMLSRKLYDKKTGKAETLDQYHDRVKQDLMMAEKRLKEELNNRHSIVAFPYGATNIDVLRICKSLGIDISFTVKPGINDRETWNGYRMNAGNQKIATKDLVNEMKQQGNSKLSRSPYIMSWNGTKVSLTRPALKRDEVWYLPLRDVKNNFKLRIEVDPGKQQIVMFPGK